MAKQPASRSASGAWQWGRTAQTQRALLDAAREVFVEQGFSEASIADVVERAGSSVGSLYHHFGGKSELFLALWQEHQQALEEAASKAVAAAKRAGVNDPVARGLAYGTVALGIGTAQAASEGEIQGAVAGIAMGIAGLVVSMSAPALLAWLIHLLIR